MVCQACENVLLRKAEPCKDKYGIERTTHHRDIESLRQAVELEACPLCRELWQELRQNAEHVDYEILDIHDHAGRQPLCPPEIPATVAEVFPEYLRLRFMHTDEDHPVLAYWDLFRPGEGWEANLQDLKLSKSTGITNTKVVASKWLQECCEKHNLCNSGYSRRGWNPTRLLDLKAAASGIIKLIDHCSSMPPVTYATLSHRWGKAHFLQLTHATEMRLKTGIKPAELPETFMEAVEVATTLGVHYLWIDSLCIMQGVDGRTDWIREASLMHKVYQHGHFNISATASDDAYAGLYRARRDFIKRLAEIDVVDDADITDRRFAQPSWLWSSEVDNANLNRRGWVLQERILSKRVLHFGAGQLFWECRELEASELWPAGGKGAAKGPSVKRLNMARDADDDPFQDQHMYRTWNRVIEKYSKCSLTYPRDKLPAVMGIAKRVNETLHDTYIAGMWKRNLVRSLAWASRLESYMHNPRPAEWRAPTWSWASTDALIRHPEYQMECAVLTIEKLSLDYATEDPYGPLLSGCLYVKGIVRRVTIHEAANPEFGFELAFTLVPVLQAESALGSMVCLDFGQENFEAENEAGLLFCVQLNHSESYMEHLQMLLLRRVPTSQGTFERIGLFSADEQAREIQTLPKGEPDLPCVSYDAESGLHTVCIV